LSVESQEIPGPAATYGTKNYLATSGGVSFAPGELSAPRIAPEETKEAWTPPKSSGGLRTVSSTPRSPTGQVQTTTREATRPLPVLPTLPEFNMPEWDEGEITKLTQKYAAPGVRSLRAQVQQAQAAPYENPNVKRMALRDALQGYGIGLEGVMAGAARSAAGEYGQKYATQAQEAQVRHEDVVKQMTTNFEAAMQEYMASMTETRESENVYGDEEAGGFTQPFRSPLLRLNTGNVGPY